MNENGVVENHHFLDSLFGVKRPTRRSTIPMPFNITKKKGRDFIGTNGSQISEERMHNPQTIEDNTNIGIITCM
tara:strand:- start:166 stop:387 length:222 start_codon:yes stop_codon:yes gene_type:complete